MPRHRLLRVQNRNGSRKNHALDPVKNGAATFDAQRVYAKCGEFCTGVMPNELHPRAFPKLGTRKIRSLLAGKAKNGRGRAKPHRVGCSHCAQQQQQ
jgi:hypothetical protein